MSMLYAGTIKKIFGKEGEMILKDIPPHLKNIQPDTPAKIGLSLKFAKTYKIAQWKIYPKGVMLKIEGVANDSQAKEFIESGVFVDASLSKSNYDESYKIGEIVDCKVYEESTGKFLGLICEVWIMPANDIWLLETEDGYIPLPYIDDVVKSVDKKAKTIKVQLIDGLMNLIQFKDASKKKIEIPEDDDENFE